MTFINLNTVVNNFQLKHNHGLCVKMHWMKCNSPSPTIVIKRRSPIWQISIISLHFTSQNREDPQWCVLTTGVLELLNGIGLDLDTPQEARPLLLVDFLVIPHTDCDGVFRTNIPKIKHQYNMYKYIVFLIILSLSLFLSISLYYTYLIHVL